MIAACPMAAPAWVLADWIELEALSTIGEAASIHAINSSAGIDEDAEPEELDQDSVEQDDRLARATTEVEARAKQLGSAYPFRMSGGGHRLERISGHGVGGFVYLFCLLASHLRSGGFLAQETSLDAALQEVPDLFQACATWCAAGFENGPAYALGWPRADGTAFLPKLKQIYDHFGDGQPHVSMPAGAPTEVKDDGIDVIAWKQMPDARAPANYLLAQVASGQNWRKKSVTAAISAFHATWFQQAPARAGRPAIMIPFCVDGDIDDEQDAKQGEIALRWRRLIAEHGEVFYRYLVPVYAEKGIQLHADGVRPVELVEARPRIEQFVTARVKDLQDLSAA